MKNAKKYIGLLAGALAVASVTYGGKCSSPKANDNHKKYTTTVGATQTNDHQKKDDKDISVFKTTPRFYYIVIPHEFKQFDIYDILKQKGFNINDECFEAPLYVIGKHFLNQNEFEILAKVLNELTNLDPNLFVTISQYLHKPIILLHHLDNYIARFFYYGSPKTKLICTIQEITSLLEQEMYNDVIFIYLDEFNFYHLVIPPNK